MFQDVTSETLSPYIIYFKTTFQLPFSRTAALSPSYLMCYDKQPFQSCTVFMANLDNSQESLRKSNGSGQKEECLVPSYSHILFPDGTGEGQKDTECHWWWFFIFALVGFCCGWLVGLSRLRVFVFLVFFSKKCGFLSRAFL